MPDMFLITFMIIYIMCTQTVLIHSIYYKIPQKYIVEGWDRIIINRPIIFHIFLNNLSIPLWDLSILLWITGLVQHLASKYQSKVLQKFKNWLSLLQTVACNTPLTSSICISELIRNSLLWNEWLCAPCLPPPAPHTHKVTCKSSKPQCLEMEPLRI